LSNLADSGATLAAERLRSMGEMNKAMRSLICCMVYLIAGPLWASSGYPPIGVEMPVERVSAHAYYVRGMPGIATDNEGFVSNAGFVVTKEGVVVFDSLGTPSLAWALRQKIREITDQPVVKVVVSHYHADHVYDLGTF
jgi:glyoxylase-like metal-dependent hydrolase (beta-lactamase superfamily II)